MEYRKIAELKKLEGNPRIIKDKQFRSLCKSIRENTQYFAARPIILSNRTGELVIIAGNQRYEAARAERMEEVPTFLMEDLTEEKEREIIIRDNVSNGEWDVDILANEWTDFDLGDWGINIQTGWDIPMQSDGKMRSNFNEGKGDDNHERLATLTTNGAEGCQHDVSDKYPVTFIFTKEEWEAWETFKDSLKVRDDKTALLRIIRGKDA